jgi:uncharacterized protein (DUF1778 family)
MAKPLLSPRRHRLEVRVTPEQGAPIRQAADLEDTTVTAFVLDTVTSRARRVIKDQDAIVLSNGAFDRFSTAELRTFEPASVEPLQIWWPSPRRSCWPALHRFYCGRELPFLDSSGLLP